MTRKRLKKLIMSYEVQRNDAEFIIARYSSIGFTNESIYKVLHWGLVIGKTGKTIKKAVERFRNDIMEVLSCSRNGSGRCA